MRQLTLDVTLRGGPRLEGFHPEPNGLALGAVQALVNRCGDRQLFLCGETGCGKTHLLHAACHAMAAEGRRIAYLPMGMLSARGPGVLEGWQDHDLVAIDDLDLMPAEADMEEALFHLINQVRDTGGSLIMAARTSPQGLSIKLPDLRSRMVWGPVIHLHLPDEGQMLSVIRSSAAQRGFQLPDEVCEHLLRQYPRDLGSLLAVLEILDKASLQAQRRVTLPFLRQCLEQGLIVNGHTPDSRQRNTDCTES